MKRSPLKRQSTTPRAQLRYLCDELARVLCLVDAGAVWVEPETGAAHRSREWWGKCARCGETKPLQWCHVISRARLQMRHESDNAVVMCAGCHRYMGQHWQEFRGWMIDTYGRERMERLERAARTPPAVDLEARANALELDCWDAGAGEHVEMAKERMRRRKK